MPRRHSTRKSEKPDGKSLRKSVRSEGVPRWIGIGFYVEIEEGYSRARVKG